MRFVCESCQTRYVVPDDRLQGRTLKVRCKKCGNLILIKGQAEAPAARPVADDTTQMVDVDAQRKLREQSQGIAATGRDAPSEDEPPEWHVILPAGQQGPLPLSALIQKMVSGEMPARAYVWRDGMGDWKRAEQVPEVARWLPALRPQSRASIPAASPTSRPPVSAQVVENSEPSNGSASILTARADPLARVARSPEFASAKPGELTKFYITQALTKPRSPWALLAFGVGAVVLLVGGLVGLAELGVQMPLVSTEPGTKPKIFAGSQGDAHVRDLLYGHPKSQAAPGGSAAQRSAAQGQAEQAAGQGQGPLAKRAEQHVDQLGKSDKDQLSRLYASQDLSTLKLKPSQGALPVVERSDAPLTAEQVSRTVSKFQSGYTRCIDAELKRNPNFQGGRIRIVTTIMSSGLVRQAQLVSDDQRLQRSVAGGPLGGCLSEQTRRMVFPSFQGDPFDAEIPLVLSSAAL